MLRTTSVDSRATDAGKDLILHLSTTVEGLCALCDNGQCNEEWYSASWPDEYSFCGSYVASNLPQHKTALNSSHIAFILLLYVSYLY